MGTFRSQNVLPVCSYKRWYKVQLVVAHTYNPSTRKAQAGESLEFKESQAYTEKNPVSTHHPAIEERDGI